VGYFLGFGEDISLLQFFFSVAMLGKQNKYEWE
jgi:hypothetical protein